MDPHYAEIRPLPTGFFSSEAASVIALKSAWLERKGDLKNTRALETFNERLYRSWAIETGIIERLYTIDRGTTLVLIEKGLSESLIAHDSANGEPKTVLSFVKTHREAIDSILDQISEGRGISNFFVRGLHQLITRDQTHTEAIDLLGRPVQVQLERGVWKSGPNNPRRPDGTFHAYCPPELVGAEMDRMLAIHTKMLEENTDALIRSAWLHHAFTQIHPFQDGNGRVARALSAYILIQGDYFPVVVSRDERTRYIEALERADGGDLDPLVNLWASLEKRELSRALSLAEEIVAEEDPTSKGSLSLIFEAAADTLKQRKASTLAKYRAALSAADGLEGIARKIFEDVAESLNLKVLHGDGKATVEHSTEESRHWFRPQFVELAKSRGYFANFPEYHRWVRLKIAELVGGDQSRGEIVVSLHPIGQTFVGAMACNAYFAQRTLNEDGQSVSSQPIPLSEELFSFTWKEKAADIEKRFRQWLDGVAILGIESWRRTL